MVTNVKLKVSTHSASSGSKVRFAGSVFPGAGGGLVSIQKVSSRSGSYVTIAHARLGGTTTENGLPQSSYARSIRLHRSGVFRALMPGTADISEGTSRRTSVHVH